jgi:ABC-type uncharacterized transport system ATPase subunit
VPYDFAAVEALDYKTEFGLGEDDLELENDGHKVTVRFNSDIIPVENILNYTLSKTHVKDINVTDADIEEIIKGIYRSEVKLDA